MAIGQRPLTLGEILDRTVQLFRSNFSLFTGISAAPSALTVLVSGAWSVLILARLGGAKPAASHMGELGLQLLLYMVIGIPVLLTVGSFEVACTNFAALGVIHGQAATVSGSYVKAFRRFWRNLWLMALQVLFAWIIPYCVLIGFFVVGSILAFLVGRFGTGTPSQVVGVLMVLLLIPLLLAYFAAGVWLWIRFSLAFPASASEDKSAWQSIKRSGSLTKGTRWRIFVMFLLIFTLTIAVQFAFSIPVDIAISLAAGKSYSFLHPNPAIAVLLQIVNLGISFLVRTIVTPVYVIALMLFYFDQRTREEGYDIELLMAQAGWSQLPPSPQSLAEESPLGPPSSSPGGPIAAQGPETAPPLQPAAEQPGVAGAHPEVSGA